MHTRQNIFTMKTKSKNETKQKTKISKLRDVLLHSKYFLKTNFAPKLTISKKI